MFGIHTAASRFFWCSCQIAGEVLQTSMASADDLMDHPRPQLRLKPVSKHGLRATSTAYSERPIFFWDQGREPELYSRRGRAIVLAKMKSPPAVFGAPPEEARHFRYVGDRLREALSAVRHLTRSADVIRDSLPDASGFLSRADFHRFFAHELQLLEDPSNADKLTLDMDELFDSLDRDGRGKIDYRSLHRFLRAGADSRLDDPFLLEPRRASDRIPAWDRIFLTQGGRKPNWSARKVDGASGIVVHTSQDSRLARGALMSRANAGASNMCGSPASRPSEASDTLLLNSSDSADALARLGRRTRQPTTKLAVRESMRLTPLSKKLAALEAPL